MTKALTKLAILIPTILFFAPKISLGFLGTGCDSEIGFWNKFICEHFGLVFIVDILVVLIMFAFAIYVIIFFIRKIAGRETSFLNKKAFYIFFGITVLSGIIFYLILGATQLKSLQ